jgi:hypothetical protein
MYLSLFALLRKTRRAYLSYHLVAGLRPMKRLLHLIVPRHHQVFDPNRYRRLKLVTHPIRCHPLLAAVVAPSRRLPSFRSCRRGRESLPSLLRLAGCWTVRPIVLVVQEVGSSHP